ncbi:hypothetical protein FNH07_06625 [Amycolatopsis bartoniae]|nr:hypothetical protein FNH07_06625 [Amycolatopsis bartoniae]
MSSPHHRPPMEASNEAEPGQLAVARGEGDAYFRALKAMEQESGAVLKAAGEYLVALVQENAEGMHGWEDGQLVWHEAAEDANGHLEIAVADLADGRFVPGLDVTVTVSRGGEEIFTAALPFLWHPFLHHYGCNFAMPGPGTYTVQVHISAPDFLRHDPVNGKRFAEPVEVAFTGVRFEPGRKPSPQAEPRGTAAPTAGR